MVGDGVVVLGVVGVVAVVRGWKIGSGAFARSTIAGGADASVGRVTFGLSGKGFLLGGDRTSEGNITRGLGAGAVIGGGGFIFLLTRHRTHWSSVGWSCHEEARQSSIKAARVELRGGTLIAAPGRAEGKWKGQGCRT